jgi:hypothetical protein
VLRFCKSPYILFAVIED